MEKEIPKYKDIEREILEALQRKLPASGIHEMNGLSIVGITMISMQDELSGISFGGRTVPVVVVIGNESGRVYQFALKALLPELDI